YKETLLTNLREKLAIPINTPSQWDAEKTSAFKIEKGIQIDNKNFPVVFFGENDLNVSSFGKGKNVYEIFKNDPETKSKIKALNSALNLNNVLVSYNRIAVLNASTFGLVGNVRLESYLFLYNSNGDLIIDAYGFTKPNPIKGKELREYKTELDKFEEINGKLTQELSKYFKK
ncbi:hypothetical protein, partial [Aphanothece microscopica]|uniref:hypothetical protein n=1 Tax=Aphanothece microscopica TaxID=1049561 RepID=UPI003984D95B